MSNRVNKARNGFNFQASQMRPSYSFYVDRRSDITHALECHVNAVHHGATAQPDCRACNEIAAKLKGLTR